MIRAFWAGGKRAGGAGRRRWPPVALLAFAMAAWGPISLGAAPGLGELTLDGAALQAIISGNMPGPIAVGLPGVGQVKLRLQAPRTVKLIAGGIEGVFAVRVEGMGLTGSVDVRYEPELLRKQGRVRLRPVRAQAGGGPLSLLPDLSSLLPVVEVPRAFEWLSPTPDRPQGRMRLFVQDVKIREDRLAIEFSLLTRALPGRKR